MTMDINFLRILVMVLALAAFLGIVWWAYAPRRRERFERDALLPFNDAGESHGPSFGAHAGVPSPLPPLPSGERKGTARNGAGAVSRSNDRGRP
jgi:cytochrome c oxidase cbb3-type subunit 4